MKKKFTLGRAARILAFSLAFCAVVLLSFPNSLAKFYNAFKGDSNASVAKFKVDLKSSSQTMNFNGSTYPYPTETISYDFTLTCDAEVEIGYVIAVDFGTTPPPANVRLWVDNEGTAKACDGSQTAFTFSGYDYKIGDSAKAHSLYVEVSYMNGNEAYDFPSFASNVSVTVTAEQKTPTK